MIKKKRIKEINKLIKEGESFSFENNSKKNSHGIFSFASADFLAWFSKVNSLIYNHYDENSGPAKMIESVNKRHFNGFYSESFEAELVKIQGAIISCKDLKPSYKNYTVNLLKKQLFWSIVIASRTKPGERTGKCGPSPGGWYGMWKKSWVPGLMRIKRTRRGNTSGNGRVLSLLLVT